MYLILFSLVEIKSSYRLSHTPKATMEKSAEFELNKRAKGGRKELEHDVAKMWKWCDKIDRRLSTLVTAEELNLDKETVRRILAKDLKKGRWF